MQNSYPMTDWLTPCSSNVSQLSLMILKMAAWIVVSIVLLSFKSLLSCGSCISCYQWIMSVFVVSGGGCSIVRRIAKPFAGERKWLSFTSWWTGDGIDLSLGLGRQILGDAVMTWTLALNGCMVPEKDTCFGNIELQLQVITVVVVLVLTVALSSIAERCGTLYLLLTCLVSKICKGRARSVLQYKLELQLTL